MPRKARAHWPHGYVFDVVGLRHLHTHLLERVAYSFSSFHDGIRVSVLHPIFDFHFLPHVFFPFVLVSPHPSLLFHVDKRKRQTVRRNETK